MAPWVLLLSVQAIRCGAVWDGSGRILEDARILVRGDRIEAIGPAKMISAAGRTELDLRPLYCLPGLVDAHTHVTSHLATDGESTDDRHAASLRNARRTLEAGITSARDLGDSLSEGLWIRDEIRAGRAVGPRLQVACEQIGPNPMHHDLAPSQIRQLVDEHIRRGCDVIKLFATGGIGDPQRLLSSTQLRAAVKEAHAHGKRVAVHVVSREATAESIAAGVDSIEHGSETDVALARLMKRRGIVLVPTLYILRYYIDDGPHLGFSADHIAKLRQLVEGPPIRPFEARFPAIVATGVRIAAGSDAFLELHGRNATELAWLVHAGMTPQQALLAMTRVAAELLGWKRQVGRLGQGAYADLIAVGGNPLEDVTLLEHPSVVISGGVVVKPADAAQRKNAASAPSTPRREPQQ